MGAERKGGSFPWSNCHELTLRLYSVCQVDEEVLTQKLMGADSSPDAADLRSQISCASHISSLKTPKTPARKDVSSRSNKIPEAVKKKIVLFGDNNAERTCFVPVGDTLCLRVGGGWGTYG